MQISTTIPISPVVGHLVFDPATNHIYVWTGAQWSIVGPSGGPGVVTMQRSVLGPMRLARERDEEKIKRIRGVLIYAVCGAVLGRLFVIVLEIAAGHFFP